MKIKYFILHLMSLLAVISSLAFTVINYKTHSKALLDGLDQKLVTAAHFTRALLPADFHDNIVDEKSVSKADYIKIVDSYNKLCAKLDLEYVWSIMLVDGKTVFTTGTSTSKDVSKGDHASFFQLHSNPDAYTDTFKTMKPHYQIIDDKWGRLKVVLIPFKDKHGRSYLFGASMKTTEIDALVRETLTRSIFIGGMIIILGVFFSFMVARRLSRPLEEVTEIAHRIAEGNLDQEATVSGCKETASLAASINVMSASIKKQINELRINNEQLQSSEQQLKASNQQLTANEQQLRASNQQLTANEQQLRASNQQLEAKEREQKKLVKALSIKNKELQSVVYISSHDLRSPLVNIQGFSGELRKSCAELISILEAEDDASSRERMETIIKTDVPEAVGFITSSMTKMKVLLDGLLRISRVGSSEMNITTVDMNGLMSEVRQSIEFQIQENDAEVIVGDLPECIGDGEQLNQVFTNLIDNALKYREPSRKPVIEISGQIQDGEAVYCVKDNGIGIEDDFLAKIFYIYHRLNPSGGVEGEGLGLTIISRIVERLDGKVWVESEVGKGSEFFVALPIA